MHSAMRLQPDVHENRNTIVPITSPESVKTEDEISLIDILNIFLRQRWIILGIASAFAALTTLYVLVVPRTYTVSASFIIQKRDQPAAAGLAAQLGMDLSAVDANQSPAFYAALIKTPDVLDHLVDSTFMTSTDPKPRALATIWGISNRTAKLQRQAVSEKLQKVIASSTSPKLDLVLVDVVTRDALLSRQLTDAVLQQVNWFNLRTRQSRAAAERQFDERLVAEVGADLRRAEDETQQFFQENQQPHMSAALEMEKQRLARRLEILNARYVSLVTAYDRARIDEVRDTPVITVIQTPKTPVTPDSRQLVKKTLLMFLLGLAVGLIVALLRQAFSSVRSSHDGDAREFHQLLDETSNDVRRLWIGVKQRPQSKRGSPAELS